MNTDKSIKINPFLKPLPLIIYYLIVAIDATGNGSVFGPMDIASGIFLGTLGLLVDGWGLIFLEIFLFVGPKGTAKKVMGIISIVLSAISAFWMYLLYDFIFAFAGYWRWELITILCLNFVYILIAALILGGQLRTR